MKLLKALAVLLLPILLSPTALAAGEDACRDFVFLPDTDLAPLHLFDDLSDALPGGMLTDSVRISGVWDSDSDILVYLCADGADQRIQDSIPLEIRTDGNRMIYNGMLADASRWIYLGSFRKGQQETLNLRLTVPLHWDTSHGEALQDLSWRFLAVERAPEEKPEVPIYLAECIPQTGDTAPLLTCAVILLFSGTGLVLLISKHSY